MSLTALQIDNAFEHGLGLPAPSPALVSALTSIPDDLQAIANIISLPQVQTVDAPIAQMFEIATGHASTRPTFVSLVDSGMTLPELSSALVASQTFADNYNGGELVNPNAPVSAGLVDALFLDDLGHAPTTATEAGFAGMTNAEAFLAFALSPTITAAHASAVETALFDYVGQASGAYESQIVGQADYVAAT